MKNIIKKFEILLFALSLIASTVVGSKSFIVDINKTFNVYKINPNKTLGSDDVIETEPVINNMFNLQNGLNKFGNTFNFSDEWHNAKDPRRNMLNLPLEAGLGFFLNDEALISDSSLYGWDKNETAGVNMITGTNYHQNGVYRKIRDDESNPPNLDKEEVWDSGGVNNKFYAWWKSSRGVENTSGQAVSTVLSDYFDSEFLYRNYPDAKAGTVDGIPTEESGTNKDYKVQMSKMIPMIKLVMWAYSNKSTNNAIGGASVSSIVIPLLGLAIGLLTANPIPLIMAIGSFATLILREGLTGMGGEGQDNVGTHSSIVQPFYAKFVDILYNEIIEKRIESNYNNVNSEYFHRLPKNINIFRFGGVLEHLDWSAQINSLFRDSNPHWNARTTYQVYTNFSDVQIRMVLGIDLKY